MNENQILAVAFLLPVVYDKRIAQQRSIQSTKGGLGIMAQAVNTIADAKEKAKPKGAKLSREVIKENLRCTV